MLQGNKYGAFFVGLIAGGLTGALIAVLFAPQSGSETRARINETIQLPNLRNREPEVELEAAGPEPFGAGGGRPGEY